MHMLCRLIITLSAKKHCIKRYINVNYYYYYILLYGLIRLYFILTIPSNITDPFKVRLIGGSNDSEGRVEVMYNWTWGTVCNNGWDLNDARVICRMLGFDGPMAATGSASFGQGKGDILLDDVRCNGTEDNIADCYHRGLGVNDCSHASDSGVICFSGGNILLLFLRETL